MEYTNENFEIFQDKLSEGVDSDSLLWGLRDSVFCEAFYGLGRRSYCLFYLPLGYLAYLALCWFREFRNCRRLKNGATGQVCHFLFCSGRNNHINRLYPLFKDRLIEGSCCCWVFDSHVMEHVDPAHKELFHDISGQWIYELSLRDVVRAKRMTKQLRRTCGDMFSSWDLRKITAFFIQFFAWEIFWKRQFGQVPQEIYCTFEKSPVVKAFYHAGKMQGVRSRVHWIHGLRHASIQATFATELWCMTVGDVRFFSKRVPSYCTPIKKRNPETDILVDKVGVKKSRDRELDQPVNFLFLGPGPETSYSQEMRLNDIKVIKHTQQLLGGKVCWRFRPHPSAVNRFREELAFCDVIVSEFSTNSLVSDLTWADAVGSSWSSLLLDVQETGRPIFWIQDEVRSLGGVDELIEEGIGVHASRQSFALELTRAFNLDVTL